MKLQEFVSEEVFFRFERCLTQWETLSISRSFRAWRKMLVLWHIFWCQVQRACWSRVTNFIPLICFWRFLTPPSLSQCQGQNFHAAHLCLCFSVDYFGTSLSLIHSSDMLWLVFFPLAMCLDIATSVVHKLCGKIVAFLDMLQTTKNLIVHCMGSAFA